MKKIYIDGLFFKSSGIGRYYENILSLLAESNKFIIFTTVPEEYKEEWKKKFEHFENIKPNFVKYKQFSFKNLFFHHKFLNKLVVDYYFYPHINVPLFFKGNLVITIHDFIPYTNFWNRGFFKKMFIKLFYNTSIKRSKKIILISETTKKDFLKYFPKNVKKAVKLYNFLEDDFCENSETKKENFILFVGNRKKHKNLQRLLLAFSKLNREEKLYIIGKKDSIEDEIDQIIKENNLENKVIQLTNVNDDELKDYYKKAKLFVFPSLYEGFGYPPLEALMCNTSVIASNISILVEILGEDIACFNPYKIEDIKKFLEIALNDDNFRKKLLIKGRERVKYFLKSNLKDNYINFFEEGL
jgi:glycosyltransferase involved in cell wall biosynthesis